MTSFFFRDIASIGAGVERMTALFSVTRIPHLAPDRNQEVVFVDDIIGSTYFRRCHRATFGLTKLRHMQHSSVLPADRDPVSHRVLRSFLLDLGWKVDSYRAADLAQSDTPESADRNDPREDSSAVYVASPENAAVLLHKALLLDGRRATIAELQEVLPRWLVNENALAALLYARGLIRAGDHAAAVATLSHGLAIDPASVELHREYGLALRRDGRVNDAAPHLEMALVLPRRILVQTSIDVRRNPVVVPHHIKGVEIYFYGDCFYVLRRSKEIAGVVRIAGELFAYRRTLGFRIARLLFHAPMVRKVGRAVASRALAPGAAANVRSVPSPVPESQIKRRPPLRQMCLSMLRRVVKRAALLLFAQRIELRASNITAAFDLADQASRYSVSTSATNRSTLSPTVAGR